MSSRPEPRAIGAGAWRIALSVPAYLRREFAAALGTLAEAVSFSEPDAKDRSDIEAVATGEPDRVKLAAAMALLSAGFGIPEPAFRIERLAEAEWLAASAAAGEPVRAGRFFLHGSDYYGAVPAGTIPISVDFAGAFGTGRHDSTRGCLFALAALARARRVRNMLDMGCGSGILTVAALRLWQARATACDIDPDAVRIARATFARNGLGGRARAAMADDPSRRAVMRDAPYDLVTANILARPLKAMARGLARVLAPGGRIVLSGFLADEGPRVETHYRSLGLRRRGLCDIGAWRTLVMERPGGKQQGSLVRGRPDP